MPDPADTGGSYGGSYGGYMGGGTSSYGGSGAGNATTADYEVAQSMGLTPDQYTAYALGLGNYATSSSYSGGDLSGYQAAYSAAIKAGYSTTQAGQVAGAYDNAARMSRNGYIQTSPEQFASSYASQQGWSPTSVSSTQPSYNTISNPNMTDAVATSNLAQQAGMTSDQYTNAAGNYGTASSDYYDADNSFWDDVGNYIASSFGFDEMDPSKQALGDFQTQNQANWGWDPVGTIAGLAGSAAGIPGTGVLAGSISSLLGHPIQFDLGPDVMAALGISDWGQGVDTQLAGGKYSGYDANGQPVANANYTGFQGGNSGGSGAMNEPGTGTTTPPTGTTTPPAGTGTGTGTTPVPSTRASNLQHYRDLALMNDAFAAQGRGLNPTDYSTPFNQYLDNLIANIPDTVSDASGLQSYFPQTIGNSSLDWYQGEQRSKYGNDLKGYGWDNTINSTFGDTSDDSILDKIYNEQYNPAKQYLDYAHARGMLNDTGYNQSLQGLDAQGATAHSRLDSIGAAARNSDTSMLGDFTKGAYDAASGYTLGSQFDPSSYNTQFGQQLSSRSNALEGDIRGQTPSGLFDTSKLLTDASRVQGSTSGGGSSLLDTIASRNTYNPYSSRGRGLGTTGAF